jgi:hypothetical protein
MRGNTTLIILIMALLIMVSYYAGVVSDAQAFFTGTTRLVNALTGRDAQGKFAGYPGSAPTINPTAPIS